MYIERENVTGVLITVEEYRRLNTTLWLSNAAVGRVASNYCRGTDTFFIDRRLTGDTMNSYPIEILDLLFQEKGTII